MMGILIGGMMVALVTGILAGMEIQQLRQQEKSGEVE